MAKACFGPAVTTDSSGSDSGGKLDKLHESSGPKAMGRRTYGMAYGKLSLFLFSSMWLITGCSMFQMEPKQEGLTIPSAYGSLSDTFSEGETGLSLRSDKQAYALPVEEMAVIIANTGSTTINFGEHRTLEKLQKGKWHEVPYRENFAFTDIGLVLEEGKNFKQEMPLEFLDYELTAGTYRIVKTFYMDEGAEELALATEFEIRK